MPLTEEEKGKIREEEKIRFEEQYNAVQEQNKKWIKRGLKFGGIIMVIWFLSSLILPSLIGNIFFHR